MCVCVFSLLEVASEVLLDLLVPRIREVSIVKKSRKNCLSIMHLVVLNEMTILRVNKGMQMLITFLMRLSKASERSFLLCDISTYESSDVSVVPIVFRTIR